MGFNDINFLELISKNTNFGINTDLFETNILNLSIVVCVLIYYGKNIFLIRSFKFI